MGLAALLFKDPVAFLLLTIPLLYSIILHEISHGFVAYLFGDDTAKRTGRLSLNPLVHLDPVGTLALFLVGFGWAKPVPVDYSRLRNFRVGLVCVSFAGCVTNIAIATIAILLLQFKAIAAIPMVSIVLVVMAKINIVLGSFNLIPIPPLDGSRILLAMLPKPAQIALIRIEPYGLMILFALLFTRALDPIIIAVQNSILLVIKLILRI
jgi:Zn-dependent protease